MRRTPTGARACPFFVPLDNRIFADTVSRGTGHTERNSKMAVPYMKLDNGSFVPTDVYETMTRDIDRNRYVKKYLETHSELMICQKVYWQVLDSNIEYSDNIIQAVTDMYAEAQDAFEDACDDVKTYYGAKSFYNEFIPIMGEYLTA